MSRIKAPLQLLYVEDEPSIRGYLEEYLKRHFETVVTASNGEEGLERYHACKPDLIISDIGMPAMDGITMIGEIRKSDSETPVLVTTAFSDADYLWQAINVGVTKYIKKPITLQNFSSELQSVVKVLLQKKELEKTHKIIEGISQSIGDALLVLDNACKVIFINEAAISLSGYHEGDSLAEQQESGSFIRGMEIPTLLENRLDHISDDTYLFAKSGSRSNIAVSAKPLIVDTHVEGIVIVFRDISESKATQEKLLLAKEQEIELLQLKERHHEEENENAFKKQLKIIDDDLSNIKANDLFFEVFYQPLEIMSGDTYGTIHLEEGKYLFYIIDAMGKGLAASITSIQSSSYISHSTRRALARDGFSLPLLVSSFCTFIRKKLIDYEMLCVSFVVVDEKNDTLEFANFGMPPYLAEHHDGTIEEITPNNAPILSFHDEHKLSTLRFSDYRKLLIYTDGIDECIMPNKRNYATRMMEDFAKTETLKLFMKVFEESVVKINDDVTAIRIARYPKDVDVQSELVLQSTFDDITNAVSHLANQIDFSPFDPNQLSNVQFVTNELLMNALEHGNLGIDHDHKHNLLLSGTYEEFLEQTMSQPENIEKKIFFTLQCKHMEEKSILIVTIRDEGEGFNSVGFFKYMNFDETIRFHGRGILMSVNNTDSVCYTQKGNEVTLIKKLSPAMESQNKE